MWQDTLTSLYEGTCEVEAIRTTPKYQPRPRAKSASPLMCPETAPILRVELRAGAHVIRYADEATPEVRAKPRGANALLLFTAITRDGRAHRSQAVLNRKQTTCPFVVEFEPAYDGLFITYWARWSGPRNEIGPWSEPVTVRISAPY